MSYNDFNFLRMVCDFGWDGAVEAWEGGYFYDGDCYPDDAIYGEK